MLELGVCRIDTLSLQKSVLPFGANGLKCQESDPDLEAEPVGVQYPVAHKTVDGCGARLVAIIVVKKSFDCLVSTKSAAEGESKGKAQTIEKEIVVPEFRSGSE